MARVLVAEDEVGIREFLVEALELADHQVDSAARGDDALVKLRRSTYDVLLTDITMPGLDGMSLLRAIRDEQPELQVVVLTAHGTVEMAVDAMKLGASDYLQKPVGSLDELRLVIERAAERKRLLVAEDRATRQAGDPPPLTYGDPLMKPVVAALKKVAATSATVLLLGESGTGKEVAARALHRWSDRAAKPFVAINCAALSETLLMSELFGHEKGAFTGAHTRRRGRIELADGGTFFLDEVGELSSDAQAKLLRVLEERAFERVGGHQTITVDVRWVGATNRDLNAMVSEGTFRGDLFHRLAVFPVRLPALRERHHDLLPLAEHLLVRVAGDLSRPRLSLSPDAARFIGSAPWEGNIRELRNALERGAILAGPDGVISAADLSFGSATPARGTADPVGATGTLADMERDAILRTLAAVDGNRRLAAEQLGIGVRTLYDKLKRYGVSDTAES